MSIQLPRNQKELHFTGSVRALGPERPANPLGRERPKGALPTPVPSRPQQAPHVFAAEAVLPTIPGPKKLTTVRGQLASMDDDQLTEALDRDIINAALFPVARRENAGVAPLNLPVPHFRSAAEARAHHAPPTIVIAKRSHGGGGLPLSVWLIAALISGIVSYQVAPQAVASLTQAVRGGERAEPPETP
jgi:hypothetical protein